MAGLRSDVAARPEAVELLDAELTVLDCWLSPAEVAAAWSTVRSRGATD